MASSRRVKMGPGRRPLSAKRQRFMELRARGWSVRAAARKVGASRSSGTAWTSGHKTYRNGVVVGFVPPLDPLAVRQISARYPSQDERIEIADLRRAGLSMRAIADKLTRAPSTISRGRGRNVTQAGRGYQPFEAYRRATARRARHHRRRVDNNEQFGVLVAELLGRRWSPQQISRHLRVLFADGRSTWLSHESIYQAVYQPNSRILRPTRLAPHRVHPWVAAEITAAPISASGAAGRDSSSPCSPSATAISYPSTGPKPDTGRATSSSVATTSQRSARWSSARPGHCAWCICLARIPTRCIPLWSTGCRTCRRSCCGRSPGTRAPRGPATSRTLIEFLLDCQQVLQRRVGEGDALGKVVAQQPIGVLVGAPLPR